MIVPQDRDDAIETNGKKVADVVDNSPRDEALHTLQQDMSTSVVKTELKGGFMALWYAAIRHWELVAVGLLFGAALVFLWVYQVVFDVHGPRLSISPRFPRTYATSVSVVIDTVDFGIGRSDTNMNNLADLAPTYAQLLTSDMVLRNAGSTLRTTIDPKTVASTVEPGSPIITLKVEGTEPAGLVARAKAILGALQDYITAAQEQRQVPQQFRLTVRGLGAPTTPTLKSTRHFEIAVILGLIPLVAALALAHRLESGENQGRHPVTTDSQIIDE